MIKTPSDLGKKFSRTLGTSLWTSRYTFNVSCYQPNEEKGKDFTGMTNETFKEERSKGAITFRLRAE